MSIQREAKAASAPRAYGDALSKGIAVVILLIALLFTQGCGVDQLWCYESAKKKAGNENIVRVAKSNDMATYVIVDENCNVRRLRYTGYFNSIQPTLMSDWILFTVEDCDPTKVVTRLKLDVDK